MVTASLEKGYPLQHTVEELSRDLFAVPSYLSVRNTFWNIMEKIIFLQSANDLSLPVYMLRTCIGFLSILSSGIFCW